MLGTRDRTDNGKGTLNLLAYQANEMGYKTNRRTCHTGLPKQEVPPLMRSLCLDDFLRMQKLEPSVRYVHAS